MESGARPDGRLWLAVGIGVNLAHAPHGRGAARRPPSPSTWPGRRPSRWTALEVLAAALRALARGLGDAGLRAHRRGLDRARATGLGERCEARLPNRTLSGVAEGLDPDGALRLRLDDGALERITAGDVFFGEA